MTSVRGVDVEEVLRAQLVDDALLALPSVVVAGEWVVGEPYDDATALAIDHTGLRDAAGLRAERALLLGLMLVGYGGLQRFL